MAKDYYDQIDRMINEGLGGGFIIYDYDVKKFEQPLGKKKTAKQAPIKQDTHDDIDRMINEGLGGGFIIHDYDHLKLTPELKDDNHPMGA